MCSKPRRMHGGSGTRLYYVWSHMRRRCSNPKDVGYKNYGGRGIKVCEEWVDDFVAFREWALASGYRESLTLERIDVNGDYCPENCTWIPKSEQSKNRRNVRMYNGVPACEIARKNGISHIDVYMRITHYGWTLEEAIGVVEHQYKSNWGNRAKHGDGYRKTVPRERKR